MICYATLDNEDKELCLLARELTALATDLQHYEKDSSSSPEVKTTNWELLRQQAEKLLIHSTEHFMKEEVTMREDSCYDDRQAYASHARDHADLSDKALTLMRLVMDSHNLDTCTQLATELALGITAHYERFDKSVLVTSAAH